jgi:AraC family transcriptional regulator
MNRFACAVLLAVLPLATAAIAKPAATLARVTVVELAAQPAIVKTVRAAPAELETALTAAYLELIALVPERGLVVAGPPFARYPAGYPRDARPVTVEAGLPLRLTAAARRRLADKPLASGIAIVDLPAGASAVVEHRGRREELAQVHAALDAWLTDHARTGGLRWEVYTTNPITTPDPAAQRTRVVVPLAREP